MPSSRKTNWLICYDIANPGRLQRVHRIVRRFAATCQYSIYCKTATRREIVKLLDDLEPVIDPRRDDVRVYPLWPAGSHLEAGREYFPDGVYFMDD